MAASSLSFITEAVPSTCLVSRKQFSQRRLANKTDHRAITISQFHLAHVREPGYLVHGEEHTRCEYDQDRTLFFLITLTIERGRRHPLEPQNSSHDRGRPYKQRSQIPYLSGSRCTHNFIDISAETAISPRMHSILPLLLNPPRSTPDLRFTL